MNLPELIDEHQQLKIQTPSLNKQSLQTSLDMKMHGIQRMRALLFPKPFAKLEDINLNKYEISINELSMTFQITSKIYNRKFHTMCPRIKNLQ